MYDREDGCGSSAGIAGEATVVVAASSAIVVSAALRLQPAADVRCGPATTLRKMGRTAEAREHDGHVLGITGSEAGAYDAEGTAMEALGRLGDARKAYESALQAGWDPARMRENLARIDAMIRGLARAKDVAFSGLTVPRSR